MEDIEVIESENSEEEEADEDVDLTMDVVPFKEKVEKWLMNCTGGNAGTLGKDFERVFEEKTVVVKEVINETESLHSVDTEQYIKSNRRKTTTKITTTTIKKYYSMKEVAKNTQNNNGEKCANDPLPAIPTIDVAASDEDKYSCKVNRRSPRKSVTDLPSVPEGKNSKLKRKERGERDSESAHLLNSIDPCTQPDLFEDPVNASGNDAAKNVRKDRTPYNTRLNSEVRDKIRLCSEAFKSKLKRKTATVPKKRLPDKRSRVRLKPSQQRTAKVSLTARTTENSTKKSKLKNGSVQNAVNYGSLDSDSEQDDILVTCYKPSALIS